MKEHLRSSGARAQALGPSLAQGLVLGWLLPALLPAVLRGRLCLFITFALSFIISRACFLARLLLCVGRRGLCALLACGMRMTDSNFHLAQTCKWQSACED
jgi:hypothetical protein